VYPKPSFNLTVGLAAFTYHLFVFRLSALVRWELGAVLVSLWCMSGEAMKDWRFGGGGGDGGCDEGRNGRWQVEGGMMERGGCGTGGVLMFDG